MEATPAAPPRILIVDDDESVRDVISVLLSEEGYNCVVASGAEMALDLAGAGRDAAGHQRHEDAGPATACGCSRTSASATRTPR